jgi:hypothetical protein
MTARRISRGCGFVEKRGNKSGENKSREEKNCWGLCKKMVSVDSACFAGIHR